MRANYDFNKDYFAVLGVHYGACSQTVKLAYRKMARRYHPDVSKIHNAKVLFQEVALAYEVLSKYREDYCYEYDLFKLRNYAKTSSGSSKRGAEKNDYKPNNNAENNDKTSQNENRSSDNTRTAYRAQTPINGKDRVITYPLTLRYAIRLLHLGSFYIPALRQKIKFTRKAFENKTFRIKGKGYTGLFGGVAGDFLVKFDIKVDSSRYKLKGADIYSTVLINKSLMKLGEQVRLDVVSGKVEFYLPENYSSENVIKIIGKGLPADRETKAGDLYLRVIAN